MQILFKDMYCIRFWALLQKVENQKVVRNACHALEINTMEVLLEKGGGLHIGFVKGVGSLFCAFMWGTMSLLCCKVSYWNEERLKYHYVVEARLLLFHYLKKRTLFTCPNCAGQIIEMEDQNA